MCERDVYQLSPAEAALVLRDARHGYHCEHEWIEYKYEGDAIAAVRVAIRNRHCHKKEDYSTAKTLIDLALEGAL